MVKLVVEYYVGSEYSGENNIVCIKYQSKEDFLFDLEIKVTDYIEERDKFSQINQSIYDEMEKLKPKLQGKQREEALKEWSELRSKLNHTYSPSYSFRYFDEKADLFLLSDFISKENTFDAPQVNELNDWWNENQEVLWGLSN